MRFCFCKQPVFGTDKTTKVGYCKNHQYMRTDLDRRSIAQKAMDKNKNIGKVRGLIKRQPTIITPADLDERVAKEKWFRLIREKLTGTCQCGCGNPSSKHDYKNIEGKTESHFRSSCCHIFPKAHFDSVKFHPLNYVERAFWGGCHTNMDNQSMDKWPNMADWDDIKAKFYILAPLLTDEERTSKFYTHLERLVKSN